ncbi:MAG: hypothetical protein R3Y09_08050 [Clostridia bacterium]
MKRILAIFMATAICMSLMACSGKISDTLSETLNQLTQESEETDVVTEQPEVEIELPTTNNNQNEIYVGTELEMSDFDEIIVADNDECVIKITGIESESRWGYVLNVYLENKSADKNYTFVAEDISVNSVICSAWFNNEVLAGKKANVDLEINNTVLKENGIVDYTDIEIIFEAYETDNWYDENIVNETINVYPFGEENATTYVRQPQENDTILVDNEYATVTITGYQLEEDYKYMANVFVVNKTDKNLNIYADYSSVNGYMVDVYFSGYMLPETSAFGYMAWYVEDLQKNGITSIEEIELTITANDGDNWLKELINEQVTFNP